MVNKKQSAVTQKDELEIVKRYVDKEESTYVIAKHYSTNPNRIRRILLKHKVKLRDKSSAQKISISSGVSAHPTKGRVRTKEEKLKISTSKVNHWEKLPEVEKEKVRAKSKEQWEAMPDSKKEEIRRRAGEEIRKAAKFGSKLERAIQDFLSELGMKYESHKKDLIATQKLEIDLFVPSIRTIIEVDGLSHFEPIWGEEQLAKQVRFDTQKDGIILSRGFNILRIESTGSSLALARIAQLKVKILAVLDDIRINKLKSQLRVIKYD
jgi:very-short-patch-repair endonuclease